MSTNYRRMEQFTVLSIEQQGSLYRSLYPEQYPETPRYPDTEMLPVVHSRVEDVASYRLEPTDTHSKKADFIIVYKDKKEKTCLKLFFEKLQTTYGLDIEKMASSTYLKDGLMFAAISASQEVLAKRAEKLQLLFPVQDKVNDEITMYQKMKHYFSPCLESGYFKIPYHESCNEYITDQAFENGNPFTSSRIRAMLIHDIIKDVDITDEMRACEPSNKEFQKDEYHGVRWLQEKNYIIKLFLLHDKAETETLATQITWLRSWSITSLRNYFGEKVGFSFAWRSAWLSNALGPPLILGLITAIVGLATMKDAPENPHLLVKQNGTLGGAVEDGFINAMNNRMTPYYALFMCIWITLFAKIWARFKFIYAFKWGTLNFFLNFERENVKYTYLTERSSFMKAFFWILSLICSIMSGILGIIYCLAMIYAQTALSNWAMESMDDAWAANLANIGVSLVNTLLVTLIVNPIFEYTSKKLTEWERHHFDSDYERALTKRVFFNTFFNNNLRILMMLVAPRFTMYNVFKGKTDKFVFCEEGLCSEAMTWQILFFLLIKPITSLLKYFWYIGARRLFQRTGINLTCKPRRRSRRSTQCSDPVLRAFIEKQYTLYCGQRFGEKFTIMDDMNVRVAQYGFVVMFAAAFPLAPLIAFIIEVLVRRADVDRYLKRQQRPIPRRSEGVGSWEDIVGFVNIAAICTNVWIICFRSLYTLEELADVAEFFDANTKAMRSVILMSCFILLTSSIRAITQYSIIPERVKILQREEEKRAKEYMANVQ